MSTTTTTFVATDPAGYERFMGRWSQRLAPSFVEFAGVQADGHAKSGVRHRGVLWRPGHRGDG